MSVGYKTVQWSPYKRRYDTVLAGSIVAYLAGFLLVGKLVWTGVNAISDEILVLRALATAAFALLTLILCIGPLARLDRRFLPLLYNRRHLGVTMFLLAMLHGLLAMGYYHGFGYLSPPLSLLVNSSFEIPGLIALLILFLMAATSHDFWLHNLSPGVWKALHMLVYPAYVLIVLHVAWGALQSERSLLYPVLVGASLLLVITLHLVAGVREVRGERSERSDWVDACGVNDIPLNRAHVLKVKGHERIAVFHHDGGFSAIHNVCAHQAGPLGEGRIIDGCVTCPWHGFQYRPHDGCAPPPFTEKLPTYPIRIENGRVLVKLEPNPPGTPVDPARPEGPAHA